MPKYSYITRSDLYKLVWSKPQLQVCADLEITRTALLRICNTFYIPRPNSGYWTLKQLKKAPQANPLPTDKYPISFEIQLQNPRQEPPPAHVISLQKLNLRVPKKLSKPLPEVSLAKEAYLKPHSEYDHLMVAPVGLYPNILAVKVSIEQFNRSLRIINTLFKVFQKLNWPISTERKGQTHLNTVTINNIAISFRIREELKQQPRKLSPKEVNDKHLGRYVYKEKTLLPTGKLILEINEYIDGQRCTWKDTETLKIEDKLEDFLYGLSAVQIAISLRKKEQENKNREIRINHEIDQQIQNVLKDYSDQISDFFESYSSWKEAQRIQQFVDELIYTSLVEGPPTKEVQNWFSWLNQIATKSNSTPKITLSDKSPWKYEDHIFSLLRDASLNSHPKLGGGLNPSPRLFRDEYRNWLYPSFSDTD